MASRERNLYRQFALVNQPENSFSAKLQDSNLSTWTVLLRGPKDSPYENGPFTLDISFPDNFPLSPPAITFRTKIYHPNIDSSSGSIGWSLTKEEWSPVWTVDKILVMLGSLLREPDTHAECEIVPEIGSEMRERPEVYWKMAREWTERYAVSGMGCGGIK